MKRRAFTLVEILIVVAIIGLLMAIAIPNFIAARAVAQSASCIANMQQIDAAIQQWAIESKQSPQEPIAGHEDDLASYMRGKVFPRCPAGDQFYVLGGTVDDPQISCANADKPKPGMHRLPSH